MVQCSMTLRGHNPHDSQVRMEGYRMSVIVSHVCEVLHETHKKKGSEGKIQWTSAFSGSSRSTLVSRIETPPSLVHSSSK